MCGKKPLRFSALLFFVLALVGCPQALPAQEARPIYAQELTQLAKISQNLRLKLQLSQASLQDSKKTQEQLQADLQTLQNQLKALQTQVENLQSQLTRASDTSTGLQTSLTGLTQSFEQYKTEVQSKIRQLENEKLIYGGAGLLLGAAILEACHAFGLIK